LRIALDTNVVLRTASSADPEHARVRGFVEELTAVGDDLCIAPQVVYEYWVVATRPADVNGFGLSPPEARLSVDQVLRVFRLLRDPADLLSRWLDLCTSLHVSGRAAHDARLVAWMLSCDIARLVTLNSGDFKRFAEIECITPP
jgi:predicted nucleic acid-binding protein